MRASFVALAVACLLSLPTVAADRLFAVRGAPDGAVLDLPGIPAASVGVLMLEPDVLTVVLRGVELESETFHPNATWVRRVRAMGPEIIGGRESRIVLELTSSALEPAVVSARRGARVVLTGMPYPSVRPQWDRTPDIPLAPARPAPRATAPIRARDDGHSERMRRDAAAAVPWATPPTPDVPPHASPDTGHAHAPSDALPPSPPRQPRVSVVVPAPERQPEPAPRRLAPPPPPPWEDLPPIADLGERPRAIVEPAPVVLGAVSRQVVVPAGEIVMGSPLGWGHENEVPEHRVWVPTFAIDATEVTVGEFQDSPLTLPRQPEWNWSPDQPVVNVTWHEAAEYCEWVGARLPSEAEWEKAARGEEGRRYAWGDAFSPVRANTGEDGDLFDKTAPVGSFPEGAGPHGTYDQTGNVAEWVADWYDEDYYRAAPFEDPRGPDHGSLRVVRGGSFESPAREARTTVRRPLKGSARRDDVGFRCAR